MSCIPMDCVSYNAVALKRRPRRLQTVQTVQTVQTMQTEYFFSYTSSWNYFRLTFFGSSYKILLDISVCLLFMISDRDVLALDGGCSGTRKPKWRMTVTKHCTFASCSTFAVLRERAVQDDS